MPDICVICNAVCRKADSADVVTLTEKGSLRINLASEKRKDKIRTVKGERVHKECRKSYCHPRNIERLLRQEAEPTPAGRSSLKRKSESLFRFRYDCLYCGSEVDFAEEKKRLKKIV